MTNLLLLTTHISGELRSSLQKGAIIINAILHFPGGSLMQPPNAKEVSGNVFPLLLIDILQIYKRTL